MSRPPAASVAATRLAPSPSSAWSVKLTKPASPITPPAEHQPRALAERDAGQPVGPAVADEGLDDRGLGVVVEHDLGGEMVGGAGRDVDDLDEARRRMVAAEPERPAGAAGEARRAGGSVSTATGPISIRPRRLRLSSSLPSTNSRRGPLSQSSQGRVVRHAPRRPRLGERRAAPKDRSSARPPRGVEGRASRIMQTPLRVIRDVFQRRRRRAAGLARSAAGRLAPSFAGSAACSGRTESSAHAAIAP